MVAVSGFIPLGYYKDEVKTASTFRTFEGRRWSVPGDWAEVNADGTLHLLGRGSVCINTGGEKVFPEEVEEVLKTHPSVRDAVAVGAARRSASARRSARSSRPRTVRSSTLDALAPRQGARSPPYKAPRHLVVVDTIGRAPNGKVDYKRLKSLAAERLSKLDRVTDRAERRSGAMLLAASRAAPRGPATWVGSPKVPSHRHGGDVAGPPATKLPTLMRAEPGLVARGAQECR